MEYKDLFIFPDNHPPTPYDSPIMILKRGRYGFLPQGLSLCAVGWIENLGFLTGKVADECVDALFFAKESNIFNDGTRGIHFCALCDKTTNAIDFGAQVITWRGQTKTVSGHGHYLIQKESMVYMAPALIIHYILGHDYYPPQEFIQATIQGKFLTEDDLQTK